MYGRVVDDECVGWMASGFTAMIVLKRRYCCGFYIIKRWLQNFSQFAFK